ncbi:hypothetical protein GHK92_18975 [Nocardioides sp. dk4132]|uniref:hypothetical protein n=1 Tax=unclassified Nocardioides TaxID=2615069 RepID=UPI00129573DA|nr:MULTISPECIES: hypothetical protein [unclassified Nocardioides]MQW77955.1 hypothetical protein [Nocardioides sp. dk4132]QGA09122.1 hypothetical protein GFH29_18270 [Nocardioides sp. dk884]
MSHEGPESLKPYDAFDLDPRTRGMRGPRSARRQLLSRVELFFLYLRPRETVHWVTLTWGFNPLVLVITDAALITVPADFTLPLERYPGPLTVQRGRRWLTGWRTRIRDHNGRLLTLTVKEEDLAELARLT